MPRAITYSPNDDQENSVPMIMENVPIEKITIEIVDSCLRQNSNFVYEFDNNNILEVRKSKGCFYGIGDIEYYQIAFGEYCSDEDGEHYTMAHTQYFSLNNFDDAVKCFVGRLVSTKPFDYFDHSQTLEEIMQINEAILQES